MSSLEPDDDPFALTRAFFGGAGTEADGPAAGLPPPPPALRRFKIRSRLGEGATAVVFQAWDKELNRLVALKVLRDVVGLSEIARQRFRREAQVGAALSHPNVVAVHDMLEVDGRLCLVMEHVAGRPLSEVLRETPRDRNRLVGLLEQAARGVAMAHRGGIVHRDLKPSNILVTEEGLAKVGDFGLAHLAETPSPLTRTGTTLGTPLYMSPEQADGRSDDVSPRTDVYGLGAILYEVLAGRPPHGGETAAEICAAIIARDPVPPRRLDPSLPADLETVALKALEKEPARRYATAEDLADDLRRALDGEPVRARTPTWPERAWRICVRRRGALLAGAAGALLAAGTFVAYRVPRAALEANRVETEARETALREAAQRLETARSLYERAVASLYRKDSPWETTRDRLEEARGLAEEALRWTPDSATGHLLLGRIWKLEGWDERAEASMREALRLEPDFALAHYELGRLLFERIFRDSAGADAAEVALRRKAARGLAEEAAREIEVALSSPSGLDDPVARETIRALLAYTAGKPREVAAVAGEALARFPGREGVEDLHWFKGLVAAPKLQLEEFTLALAVRPKDALILSMRAATLAALERWDAALADCDEAIRINPRLPLPWYNRGVLRARKGDVDGALAAYDEAIRLQPVSPYAYFHRAILKSQRNDSAGAIADLDKTLEQEPRHVRALHHRGLLRWKAGDPDGAIADWTEALRADPRHAESLCNRGVARVLRGDFAAALTDLDAAIRIKPAYPEALAARAAARGGAGDVDGALEDFAAAIKAGSTDPTLYVNRARLWILQKKDPVRALTDINKAIDMDPSFAPAWALRAGLRADRDIDGALEDIDTALRLQPGNKQWEETRRRIRSAKGF